MCLYRRVLISPMHVQLNAPVLDRFLTARKGDVKAAYTQLKDTANWRHENNVDLILDTPYVEKEAVCVHSCSPVYIMYVLLMFVVMF